MMIDTGFSNYRRDFGNTVASRKRLAQNARQRQSLVTNAGKYHKSCFCSDKEFKNSQDSVIGGLPTSVR